MNKMARPEDSERASLIRNSNRETESAKKCLTVSGAILLPICFIVMIVLAAILKSYIEEWSSLTQVNLAVVTSLIITAGTFGLVLALMCCNGDMNIFFGVLYVFILTLQISAIVYGCIQIADKNHFMKKTMDADLRNNFAVYSIDIKKAFDGLQMEKSCCGVHGVQDYTELNRKIPISCCEIVDNMNQYCTDENLAYKEGCATKMYDDIIYNIGILSYASIGFVVLQLILGIGLVVV